MDHDARPPATRRLRLVEARLLEQAADKQVWDKGAPVFTRELVDQSKRGKATLNVCKWLGELDGRPPPLERRLAHKVVLELDGDHVHVADDVLLDIRGSLTVERDSAPLTILAPRSSHD